MELTYLNLSSLALQDCLQGCGFLRRKPVPGESAAPSEIERPRLRECHKQSPYFSPGPLSVTSGKSWV